ncbi:MAG: PKD domain-containing protein [Candidatus Saccharimonadales bacterium]
MTSRITTLLVGAGILLTSAIALTSFGATVSAAVDNDPDCDTVAIIKCGAFTASALREKAAQGDVPRVYRAFDISQADLEGTFVKGIVWRDGRVTVDGETVATGAMTAGRNYGGTPIPNTNGAGVYSTNKFVTEGQTAFVRMVNGTFDFAVIKSCGNPVSATPKPKPEPPQPKFECVSLKVSEVSRTKRTFTVKATASDGAKIVNYEYGFGDGMGVIYTEPVYRYEYKTPGTYNTSVVVHVQVGGDTKKVTSATCTVPVTILAETVVPPKPEPCPHDATLPKDSPNCKPPVTPVVMCAIVNKTQFPKDSVYCREDSVTPVATVQQEIAKTGPETIAMGGLGLGSLTAAGYYLADSRRKLLAKFLNRQ